MSKKLPKKKITNLRATKPKKHERKQKGKKGTPKGRGRTSVSPQKRSSKRDTQTSRRNVKRTKLSKKVMVKTSLQKSKRNQGTKGVKATSNKANVTRSKAGITVERKRGKESLFVDFKNVRKVEKKIELFEKSQAIDKSVKNQLRRKGGKPPKGIIIIVKDKKGNQAAQVSRPSFLASENNIKKELKRFTKDLKKDFGKAQQELADGVSEEEDYGSAENYNPDNIESIEIKFIY